MTMQTEKSALGPCSFYSIQMLQVIRVPLRILFRLLLLAGLFLWIETPDAFAEGSIPYYLPDAMACPAQSTTGDYIDVPLFYDLADIAKIERVPGLATHDELRSHYEGAQIRLYYEFLRPFDRSKPTILFVPGGPGQNHAFIHGMETLFELYTDLLETHNILAMDHRGVGCSKPLFPGNEPPESLYMRYAAADIERLRREVLGEDAELLLWGGSYGTMLSQTYALLFPDHLKRLFLWGAFSSHLDFNRAMQKYEDLVISVLPDHVLEYGFYKAKEPEYIERFLRFAGIPYYSFQGRNFTIPNVFDELIVLLESKSYKAADELLAPVEDSSGMFVAPWMMRSIACGEIFTSSPQYEGEFDLFGFGEICAEFKGRAEYFNYDDLLNQIEVPTFLYAGAYDHVTPLEAAVKMHDMLPNSYLYIDFHSGHGLDKPECFSLFLEAFFNGAEANKLDEIAYSPACLMRPSLL